MVTVEVLLQNICTTTGEGPHWEKETNSLVFVDIMSGTCYRWGEETHLTEKKTFDGSVSFIIPSEAKSYIVGYGKKIVRFSFEDGIKKILADVENGPANRFNDAKCDAKGRLWAGTMGKESAPAVPELEKGSLYSLDKDMKLTSHIHKITISNGIAWSPDNKVMYFIDSIPRKVYAFDFDLDHGLIENQRVCVDFRGTETMKDLGYPDGMTVDSDGNLWVACFLASKVVQFDPQTGEKLREVIFPDASRITSCIFGGKNLDKLFVTSANYSKKSGEIEEGFPNAGSLFCVKGLGVRGIEANVFHG